jgi:hypothetical protein
MGQEEGERKLPNSREQRGSWAAEAVRIVKILTSDLWNPGVHYHVRNSLPLVSVLSQMNAIHNLLHIPLVYILIFSSHLCPDLPGKPRKYIFN